MPRLLAQLAAVTEPLGGYGIRAPFVSVFGP